MQKVSKEKKFAVPQFAVKLAAVLLFVGGALTTAYPIYSDILNDLLANKVTTEYRSTENSEFRKKQNEKLRAQQQEKKELSDPFSKISLDRAKDIATNPPTEFLIKHTIAVLYIPKIKQQLPIFDTTNDTFMDRGATWFSQSSFPGGGKGTHTVITAHRGLPTATLFTDLDKLKNGDLFIIEMEGKYLAYKVYDQHIVLPDDLSKLDSIKEQDTATLLTCTPYMINSHRLLVVGKRVPFKPSMKKGMDSIKSAQNMKIMKLAVGLTAAGVLAIFLLYISYLRLKHARHLYDFVFKVLDEKGQPLAGMKFQLFDRRGRKPKRVNGVPIIREINAVDGTVNFEKLPGVKLKIKQVTENKQYYPLPVLKISILKRKATTFRLNLKQRKLKGIFDNSREDYRIYLKRK
ncbi:MAG: class C sortase [Lactobacillales bacterium]|jgi:sortase A|nr:class C sortase [Lactobacillales bacterium]